MTIFNTLKEANSLLDRLIKEEKISEETVKNMLEEIRKDENSCNTTMRHRKKIKKKASKDPFENCRMRHIAMQIAYDGAPYNGLAENVGCSKDNSVEKHLFAALVKCCLVKDRSSSCFSRCGRTDKGVSAFGQVIGLKVRSAFPLMDGNGNEILETLLPNNSFQKISLSVRKNLKAKGNETSECKVIHKDFTEFDFCRMLNRVLPEEIRAIGWAPVTDDFSARFSAKNRMLEREKSIFRLFLAQKMEKVKTLIRGFL